MPCGNAGNNVLTGTAFADLFSSNAGGTNTYVITNGDRVDGGSGFDTIIVTENVTFEGTIVTPSGTTDDLQGVDYAQLASGVALTIDNSDINIPMAGELRAVTGVNDDVTETLIVIGAALGQISSPDLSSGNVMLVDVVLDYRGGGGTDFVIGTAASDILSGGFGDDTLVSGNGSDTMTGGDGKDEFQVENYNSATEINVVMDFELTDNNGLPAAVDELNVISVEITDNAGGTVARQDVGSGLITLSSGSTIESFAVNGTGVSQLFDATTALATTTELYAETTSDVLAIADVLLLKMVGIFGGEQVLSFGYDGDANGIAESTIIVSSDPSQNETNIIMLVGVDYGADLVSGATISAAGQIYLS